MGAVIATYGTSAAKSWLAGLKRNAALYQDDESVVAAVDRGQAAVGIINQYYWYRLRLEQGPAHTHSQAVLLPQPRRRRDREHLGRGGARVLPPQGRRREVRGVPRLADSPADPRRRRRLRVPGPPGDRPQPRAAAAVYRSNPAVINVVTLGNDQPAASLLQQAGLT